MEVNDLLVRRASSSGAINICSSLVRCLCGWNSYELKFKILCHLP